MKINISQEDYEFLKHLQHELNVQKNDGNAEPVYWGVSEIYEEFRGESGDYGGEPYIKYDDGKLSLKEAVEEGLPANEEVITTLTMLIVIDSSAVLPFISEATILRV